MRYIGIYILNEQKQPVRIRSVIKWGRWMQNNDRQVALTVFEEEQIRVSTVFLGLDQGFNPTYPILFETMIFGGEHDGYQERYETWEQAEAGHERAIKYALQITENQNN